MNVVLCCSGGFSTSLLVERILEEASKKNVEIHIFAVGLTEIENEIENADIILLGPQIRYELDNLKDIVESKGKKIDVINMTDYGMMNGEKVLEMILKLYGG